jgi:hypothetical protein
MERGHTYELELEQSLKSARRELRSRTTVPASVCLRPHGEVHTTVVRRQRLHHTTNRVGLWGPMSVWPPDLERD